MNRHDNISNSYSGRGTLSQSHPKFKQFEEYSNLRLPLMIDLPKPTKKSIDNIYIYRFDWKNVRPTFQSERVEEQLINWSIHIHSFMTLNLQSLWFQPNPHAMLVIATNHPSTWWLIIDNDGSKWLEARGNGNIHAPCMLNQYSPFTIATTIHKHPWLPSLRSTSHCI